MKLSKKKERENIEISRDLRNHVYIIFLAGPQVSGWFIFTPEPLPELHKKKKISIKCMSSNPFTIFTDKAKKFYEALNKQLPLSTSNGIILLFNKQ